jgi:hypothetical protein
VIRILDGAPKFFLVLVPLLYTYGFSFELGRLVVFGVPPNIVERAAHEYWILSFYALSQLSNLYWDAADEILWVALMLAGVFAVAFVAFGWLRRLYLRWRPTRDTPSAWSRSRFLRPGLAGLVSGAIAPYGFFAIIFGVLLLLGWPFFLGVYTARDDIRDFRRYGCEKRLGCVVVYRENQAPLAGLLVAKSSDTVALYDGQKTVLLKVDKERFEFAPSR